MANTILGLNNVNLLTKEQYDEIQSPSLNELWAIELPTVIETYQNGSNWYRLWSDGWLEQGGDGISLGGDSTKVITLLKSYKDTNYYVNWISSSNWNTQGQGTRAVNKSTTQWTAFNGQDAVMNVLWYACGYSNL